jgi:hypothetical protein
MARKSVKRPRLSAALRRTIAADTAGCFLDNEVLGAKDVATLRQILAGKLTPDVEIERKRALGALARSDKTAQAAALIGAVLADPEAPKQERSAAAALLALLPPEPAEKALLGALDRSGGPLRFEILQSLGQVGSARALAKLEKLELPEGDLAKRALALAELAIAFREGRKGTGADALARRLELEWNRIDARRIDRKAVKEVLAGLSGPAYGVKLRDDYGLRFDCGRLRNVVLLNAALRPGSFLKDAQQGNLIAALVVAQPERKLAHFSVRWLLLASPGKERIAMALVRPNGEPAFEGEAVRDSEGLRFRLRDTGLERVPAEIEGRVTDDDIAWTIRVWQGPLRDKQRPRAITLAAAPPAG